MLTVFQELNSKGLSLSSQKEKENRSRSCVHFLHKTLRRAVTAKKCTKKRDARASCCFANETYCFIAVLVAFAVVVA